MKIPSENKALKDLRNLEKQFRRRISDDYEQKAKSCQTCETKGACCLDAHFVNVQITKLEAAAIRETLAKLNQSKQIEIYRRAAETVEKYQLSADGDTFAQTFACPLFEKEIGCLVHEQGKPAPCVAHACYENKEDLPPDELLEEVEIAIERLNVRTYNENFSQLPLPVWLEKINPFKEE